METKFNVLCTANHILYVVVEQCNIYLQIPHHQHYHAGVSWIAMAPSGPILSADER